MELLRLMYEAGPAGSTMTLPVGTTSCRRQVQTVLHESLARELYRRLGDTPAAEYLPDPTDERLLAMADVLRQELLPAGLDDQVRRQLSVHQAAPTATDAAGQPVVHAAVMVSGEPGHEIPFELLAPPWTDTADIMPLCLRPNLLAYRSYAQTPGQLPVVPDAGLRLLILYGGGQPLTSAHEKALRALAGELSKGRNCAEFVAPTSPEQAAEAIGRETAGGPWNVIAYVGHCENGGLSCGGSVVAPEQFAEWCRSLDLPPCVLVLSCGSSQLVVPRLMQPDEALAGDRRWGEPLPCAVGMQFALHGDDAVGFFEHFARSLVRDDEGCVARAFLAGRNSLEGLRRAAPVLHLRGAATHLLVKDEQHAARIRYARAGHRLTRGVVPPGHSPYARPGADCRETYVERWLSSSTVEQAHTPPEKQQKHRSAGKSGEEESAAGANPASVRAVMVRECLALGPEALAGGRVHIGLVARRGSGKSAALRAAAHRLFTAALSEPTDSGKTLPVYVPLKEFQEWRSRRLDSTAPAAGLLLAYAAEACGLGAGTPLAGSASRLAWLLDGLDEVGAETLSFLDRALGEPEFISNSVVCAGREEGISRQALTWSLFRRTSTSYSGRQDLETWGPADAARFIRGYLGERSLGLEVLTALGLAGVSAAREGGHQPGAEEWEAFAQAWLLRDPFLLTLYCQQVESAGRCALPEGPYQLILAAISKLLERRFSTPDEHFAIRENELFASLARLAVKIRFSQDAVFGITMQEAIEALGGDVKDKDLLSELLTRSGLLKEIGKAGDRRIDFEDVRFCDCLTVFALLKTYAKDGWGAMAPELAALADQPRLVSLLELLVWALPDPAPLIEHVARKWAPNRSAFGQPREQVRAAIAAELLPAIAQRGLAAQTNPQLVESLAEYARSCTACLISSLLHNGFNDQTTLQPSHGSHGGLQSVLPVYDRLAVALWQANPVLFLTPPRYGWPDLGRARPRPLDEGQPGEARLAARDSRPMRFRDCVVAWMNLRQDGLSVLLGLEASSSTRAVVRTAAGVAVVVVGLALAKAGYEGMSWAADALLGPFPPELLNKTMVIDGKTVPAWTPGERIGSLGWAATWIAATWTGFRYRDRLLPAPSPADQRVKDRFEPGARVDPSRLFDLTMDLVSVLGRSAASDPRTISTLGAILSSDAALASYGQALELNRHRSVGRVFEAMGSAAASPDLLRTMLDQIQREPSRPGYPDSMCFYHLGPAALIAPVVSKIEEMSCSLNAKLREETMDVIWGLAAVPPSACGDGPPAVPADLECRLAALAIRGSQDPVQQVRIRAAHAMNALYVRMGNLEVSRRLHEIREGSGGREFLTTTTSMADLANRGLQTRRAALALEARRDDEFVEILRTLDDSGQGDAIRLIERYCVDLASSPVLIEGLLEILRAGNSHDLNQPLILEYLIRFGVPCSPALLESLAVLIRMPGLMAWPRDLAFEVLEHCPDELLRGSPSFRDALVAMEGNVMAFSGRARARALLNRIDRIPRPPTPVQSEKPRRQPGRVLRMAGAILGAPERLRLIHWTWILAAGIAIMAAVKVPAELARAASNPAPALAPAPTAATTPAAAMTSTPTSAPG